MPQFQLKGATSLVTGGGSGISLSFVKELHVRGSNILIADLNLRPEAEEFVNQANSEHGSIRIAFHKTDVTKWQDLETSFDVAEETFGTVPDLLCAGAGIYEPPNAGFWSDIDQDSHYKILDIDLLHPIKMTRIAIRRMLKAKKSGCILHISSIACQTASLVTPLYSVAKHGVVAFTRGLAGLDELAGVRIACIAPGSIRTPLVLSDPRTKDWIDQEKDYLLDPSVVAAALITVAENKNQRYPSGTILEVTNDEEEKWRIIPLHNNPGPQGRATGASGKDRALQEIVNILGQDAGGQEILRSLANGKE